MLFLTPNPANGNDPDFSQTLVSSISSPTIGTRPTPVKNSWIARKLHDVGNSFRFGLSNVPPRAGDCVLVQVTSVSHHSRLYSDDNRYSRLFSDDLVVGVVGSRYATDAFHATQIDTSSLHMLTNGGLMGTVIHQHKSTKSPTRVELKGYLIDNAGVRVNTKDLFFTPALDAPRDINPVLVVGTGMNSGKTTSTARLGQSMARDGLDVAIIKITGSASHRDVHEFQATGAIYSGDFSDYGFPSTYLASENEIERLYCRMMTDVAAYAPDVVLIEIADGVYQRETQFLLNSKLVRDTAAGVVLTAACAPSALSVDQAVRQSDWDPIAVTGLITNSPLFVQEFSARCSTPVCDTSKGIHGITERIMSRVNARRRLSTPALAR